jgi:acyl carrier protein
MTPTRVDPATIRKTVLEVLQRIAPEVSPDALQPAKPLRNQIDLDSMDWLNFIVALHERFGVDIPEADYAKLVTLDDLVTYLAAKL